jgi:hypothetical protein
MNANQDLSVESVYEAPHSTIVSVEPIYPISWKIATAFVVISTLVGPWIGSIPYIFFGVNGISDVLFTYGLGALPSLVGSILFMRWLRKSPRQTKAEFAIQGAVYGMLGTLVLGIPIAIGGALLSGSMAAIAGVFGSGLAFALFVGIHGAVAGAVLAYAFSWLLDRDTPEVTS